MATPTPDLTPYSIEQLEVLLADVQKRLSQLRQEKRKQAFQQLDAMAKQLGLSKEELAARYAKTSRRRSAAPALYRNPVNPEQSWSGKGRKPQWVQDYLAAGKSLKDLEA